MKLRQLYEVLEGEVQHPDETAEFIKETVSKATIKDEQGDSVDWYSMGARASEALKSLCESNYQTAIPSFLDVFKSIDKALDRSQYHKQYSFFKGVTSNLHLTDPLSLLASGFLHL